MTQVDQGRVDELRENWNRAMERDQPDDAVAALVELERLDPDEPRWAHRLGEAHRRLGRQKEAEDAFVRAMDGYVRGGFVPRAVAMAKLVVSMNPARRDLLTRIEPGASGPPAGPVIKPPPLPAKAVVLARAADASDDEVRFDDAGDASSISIVLEDIEELEIVDDAALAATYPPALAFLAELQGEPLRPSEPPFGA